MKKKLKVIQIIDSLNVGGAEMLAVNIANGLLEHNIESYLCTTRKEGTLKENIHKDVGYIFLDRKATIDLKSILKLKNFIKKKEITVIHAHSTSSFMGFLVKILNPKVKLIWHDHFGDSEFLNIRSVYPFKLFSFFFNTIVSVNLSLKNWALKNLLCKHVFFINNFASFKKDEIPKNLLKGENNKRIVLVAGFRPQKDHLNALNAFKEVIKKQPDWTLHFIGKDYQDAYARSIKEFIKKNQLENSVFLYGVCSDIKHILSQATIGVLSSKSEGLPVSLLEYGLAKLPVVVTNVGECASVVKDTNALVTPNRSDMFALKLEKIMVDVALREEIATTLHHNVLNNYSKKAVISTLIQIYKSC